MSTVHGSDTIKLFLIKISIDIFHAELFWFLLLLYFSLLFFFFLPLCVISGWRAEVEGLSNDGKHGFEFWESFSLCVTWPSHMTPKSVSWFLLITHLSPIHLPEMTHTHLRESSSSKRFHEFVFCCNLIYLILFSEVSLKVTWPALNPHFGFKVFYYYY